MQTVIKWINGDGNIIATYSGSNDAPIIIASDVPNDGIDREQTIQVATVNNAQSVDVVVRQTGLREKVATVNDEILYTVDGLLIGVLKN